MRINTDKSLQYLFDTDLSLKAKGILAMLLVNPDLSKAKLKELSADGKDSIKNGIDELEEHGYLKIEEYRDRGRIIFKYIGAPYPKYKPLRLHTKANREDCFK